MTLAYIVIAYKNFPQVERLIRRLFSDSAHFVLMIDAKVPDEDYEALRAQFTKDENVHFAPRHSISWGAFSLTRANIVGIRTLIERQIPFDYVFSISGQDYPLATTSLLEATMRNAAGKSFIEYEPLPIPWWIDGGIGRLYSWNIILPGRRILQVPKATQANNSFVQFTYDLLGRFVKSRPDLPDKMTPFGGSMHWILSREAAEYVDWFIETQPAFVKRFRWTLVSDELFFQTILANSPLKDKLINDDMRYLRWPAEHAPSPVVLTLVDLPMLIASKKLFGRKFDMNVDSQVLDEIDHWLDGND